MECQSKNSFQKLLSHMNNCDIAHKFREKFFHSTEKKYGRYIKQWRECLDNFIGCVSSKYIAKIEAKFLEYGDSVDVYDFCEILYPFFELGEPITESAFLEGFTTQGLYLDCAKRLFDDIDVYNTGHISMDDMITFFIDMVKLEKIKKFELESNGFSIKKNPQSFPNKKCQIEKLIILPEKPLHITSSSPLPAFHNHSVILASIINAKGIQNQGQIQLYNTQLEPTHSMKDSASASTFFLDACTMNRHSINLVTSASDRSVRLYDVQGNMLFKWENKRRSSNGHSIFSPKNVLYFPESDRLLITDQNTPEFRILNASFEKNATSGSIDDYIHKETSLCGGTITDWESYMHVMYNINPIEHTSVVDKLRFNDSQKKNKQWKLFNTSVPSRMTMARQNHLHHSTPIHVVAQSTQQDTFATGGLDGTVLLWDSHRCEPIMKTSAHDKLVSSLSYPAMKDGLLTSGLDGRVLLWSVLSGDCVGSVPMENTSAGIQGLCAIPDSYEIAALDVRGIVRTWDLRNLKKGTLNKMLLLPSKPKEILGKDKGGAKDVVFHSLVALNRNTLVVGGGELLRLDRERCEGEKGVTDGEIVGVVTNSRVFQYLTASDKSVRLWDIFTGQSVTEYSPMKDNTYDASSTGDHYITTVAVDNTEKRLLVGYDNGSLTIHNFVSGRHLKTLGDGPKQEKVRGIIAGVYSAEWNKVGELILVLSLSNSTLRIFDDSEKKCERRRMLTPVRIVSLGIPSPTSSLSLMATHKILLGCNDQGFIEWADYSNPKQINTPLVLNLKNSDHGSSTLDNNKTFITHSISSKFFPISFLLDKEKLLSTIIFPVPFHYTGIPTKTLQQFVREGAWENKNPKVDYSLIGQLERKRLQLKMKPTCLLKKQLSVNITCLQKKFLHKLQLEATLGRRMEEEEKGEKECATVNFEDVDIFCGKLNQQQYLSKNLKKKQHTLLRNLCDVRLLRKTRPSSTHVNIDYCQDSEVSTLHLHEDIKRKIILLFIGFHNGSISCYDISSLCLKAFALESRLLLTLPYTCLSEIAFESQTEERKINTSFEVLMEERIKAIMDKKNDLSKFNELDLFFYEQCLLAHYKKEQKRSNTVDLREHGDVTRDIAEGNIGSIVLLAKKKFQEIIKGFENRLRGFADFQLVWHLPFASPSKRQIIKVASSPENPFIISIDTDSYASIFHLETGVFLGRLRTGILSRYKVLFDCDSLWKKSRRIIHNLQKEITARKHARKKRSIGRIEKFRSLNDEGTNLVQQEKASENIKTIKMANNIRGGAVSKVGPTLLHYSTEERTTRNNETKDENEPFMDTFFDCVSLKAKKLRPIAGELGNKLLLQHTLRSTRREERRSEIQNRILTTIFPNAREKSTNEIFKYKEYETVKFDAPFMTSRSTGRSQTLPETHQSFSNQNIVQKWEKLTRIINLGN